MVSMIVAMDRQNIIAVDGQIPWYVPEELSYFAKTTRRKVVVMGRKTFDSLGRRPLENRLNIVLTRSDSIDYPINIDQRPFAIDGPSEIINFSNPEHVFVIGGREIYSLFAPYTQKLYVTVVNSKEDYKGNKVYFPWEAFSNIKWKVKDNIKNKLYNTFIFERT